ncbi:MAG: insulinase family protein, partial [Alphaproteobacteria bacterium]|nr:insulinase family protein [Alphaproteobacteria bacterium]
MVRGVHHDAVRVYRDRVVVGEALRYQGAVVTWLAVAMAGGVALAADPEVRALDADRRWLDTRLDNGLHLTVLEDPRMPMEATQHWVHVGSAQEGDRERGFAHLFEHLMFGDTPAHAAEDYDRLHVASGGRSNAWTSFDETVYVSLIAPDQHDALLALEADRFGTLAVTAENLANEQRIVTEELRLRTQNDPFSRLFVTALDRALAGHPYAHTAAGTADDIAAADLALCRDFQARWYRPDHIHLVVVGPRPVEDVFASVRTLYAGLAPSGAPAATTLSVLDLDLPSQVSLAEDLPPIRITALAWLLPPTGHPDDAALSVLLEALAGGLVDRFSERHVDQTHRALYGQLLSARLKAGGAVGVYGVSFFKGKEAAFRALGRTI